MSGSVAPIEGLRCLYLHGFASGLRSAKGVALARHLGAMGVSLTALDLRIPSMTHPRLSEMIRATRAAIGSGTHRAVLVGSSLGGLCAARVAERDPRVVGLVLLAPAFRFAERWKERLGAEWQLWQSTGWREFHDYAANGTVKVDWGFIEDAAAVDLANDGWPDVRVPTVIVHGRGDIVVDVALSRAWARGKDHVVLEEVNDGHDLLLSIPEILAVCERVLRSLS